MGVTLQKARINDAERIHKMQAIAFMSLLEKYQDFDTNPACESLERIKQRMERSTTDHYFILSDDIGISNDNIGISDDNITNVSGDNVIGISNDNIIDVSNNNVIGVSNNVIGISDDNIIGAIRINRLESEIYYLTSIFVLPSFQGKGYAKEAIQAVELLYPDAKKWVLDTIKQETKLVCLYEKMGYKLSGQEKRIKESMDLVYMIKEINHEI